MAFNDKGEWDFEDDSVAKRIASITSSSSPLMRKAASTGMQGANRRGLGNSSMAVGAAHGAVIDAAAPIAGQEAGQIHAMNMGRLGRDQQTKTIGMEAAIRDRETMANVMATLQANRYNALSNTLANENIPGATRAGVQRSINDQYASAMAYLQNLYGVSVSTLPPSQTPPAQQPVTPAPVTGPSTAPRWMGGFGSAM